MQVRVSISEADIASVTPGEPGVARRAGLVLVTNDVVRWLPIPQEVAPQLGRGQGGLGSR
jgi:hypothetical protein